MAETQQPSRLQPITGDLRLDSRTLARSLRWSAMTRANPALEI
jgi:hypothetical protein